MAKVWLITGSSRGLGRALAAAVLSSGDTLVASARDPRALEGLVRDHADRALALALDVTRPDEARRAVHATVERFGRLDVLVNNAGYANVAAIEDVDEADFRAQLDTNFFGVFHVTRAALPVLRNQGQGHIIQGSSVVGRRPSLRRLQTDYIDLYWLHNSDVQTPIEECPTPRRGGSSRLT